MAEHSHVSPANTLESDEFDPTVRFEKANKHVTATCDINCTLSLFYEIQLVAKFSKRTSHPSKQN